MSKSKAKLVLLTDSNTCNFCNNAIAKYACPKCNLLYCTLSCYQSEQHSECSEQFYKSCVQETIQGASDEESQVKMQEVLARFHQQHQLAAAQSTTNMLDSDDDDDKECQELGERLAGVDLDDSEQVWQKLTSEERAEFEKFLQSADVAHLIPIWTPWWCGCNSKTILDEQEFALIKDKAPAICVAIRDFMEISETSPAHCVEHNLINVLATYSFLVRYFNGEHSDLSEEFAVFLCTLSLNLNKNVNFDTSQQAMESVKMQCLQNQELAIVADKENLDHIEGDVDMILAGPYSSESKFYILAALSDMKTVLEHATIKRTETAKKGPFYEKVTASQSNAVRQNKARIKGACRKVDYYLSFIKDLYRVSV